MTKGKSAQLFCELHRDIGVLSRLMKSRKHKDRRSSSHSSQPGSTPHRSSKRSRNYRESSVSGSDEDSDEDNEEDEEDLDHDGASDEDSDERMDEPTIEESEEEGLGRLKSTQQSSRSGSKGRLRRSQLFEGGQRRKKERSSDSEEIDVDDTEAILGSSTGNVGPLDARKRQKSIKITPKESAAESQRRRLLMSLDKNKRKQSTGGTGIGALASIANLSAMPIRTLGGVGPPAATPPPLGSALGSEPRQKPPGINRYATIGGPFDSASSPSGYSPMNQPSPSLGSSDRFSSNGHSPNSNRDGAAKNLKGLTFELDPAIDMSSIKTSSPLSASAQPSPVVSHFPNPGSPVLARLSERQQHSPRGSISISMAEENRELQAKVTSLESSIQSLTQQLHLLQARSNFNDNPVNASSVHPSSSASSISHTPSSTSSTPSAVATGTSAPAQELQGRFDKLQHQHAQEKIRNLTLRENLQTLFGYLQVPVAIPPGTNDYQGSNVFEWKADKLDEYVQALRDTIIGSESSPGGPSMPGVTPKHPLDTRRRDMIVDRVMREIGM
ncbi:hypothetical protein BGW38_010561 [Lunasporangiospora selenospora]|uniref:Uncharacterized protein n=1 Tax=Lunasporangiospora selenospora TaxID=979761 RepID=A0A9P6FY99_9FUNG|nr:hypothetical protein BGW38_010561 [Lunasporangiospora selenospora]